MPRTAVNVNTITRQGIAPVTEVAGDVANGNFINNKNERDMWLEVTNTGGSPYTVTFVTPGTVGEFAVADFVLTVPASAKRRIGPFPSTLFGDTVEFNVQNVAVTVAAYQCVPQ